MLYNVMKAAFQDELEKIAGHARSGRRPLKASTLLDKEKDGAGEARKKLADLTKLSGLGDKIMPDAKTLGLLAAGGYTYHTLRKARRRYEIGRQMEMQNQGF